MTAPVVSEVEALPELALWLAIQHQGEQQKIAGKAAAGLALLWQLLRFDSLDDSTPAWLHGVTLQVEQQFRESEQAAFVYTQGARWAVEPLSEPMVKIDTAFPVRDFQLAMRATGPGSVKQATARAVAAPVRDSEALLAPPGTDAPVRDLSGLVDDLLAFGKLNSTGVGVKFALNGGRGEVQQLVLADARTRTEPIGWARFTEDSFDPKTGKPTGPCYFCALLASQGAVYYDSTSFDRSNNKIREVERVPDDVADLVAKLDQRARDKGLTLPTRRAFIGEGLAKVHDHCRCSIRPVYRLEDKFDERAEFFRKQWNGAPAGSDPKDSLRKFRQVYKRPTPYSDTPAVSLAAVRRNRDAVVDELGASSPHAKWWNRQVRELEKLV